MSVIGFICGFIAGFTIGCWALWFYVKDMIEPHNVTLSIDGEELIDVLDSIKATRELEEELKLKGK